MELNDLPYELLYKIFSNIENYNLLKIRKTCKLFKFICDDITYNRINNSDIEKPISLKFMYNIFKCEIYNNILLDKIINLIFILSILSISNLFLIGLNRL